jgi:ectoine hydroxylase-related dioxygenase (phytanoyl-CoA dioxygenase family)
MFATQYADDVDGAFGHDEVSDARDPSTLQFRRSQCSQHSLTGVVLRQMPNHVKIAVKAGSAFVFDSSIWHTALANASDRPRCGVTLFWESSRMKDGVPAVSAATAQRLRERGRMPLSRQRLFALPNTGLPTQAIARSEKAHFQIPEPAPRSSE